MPSLSGAALHAVVLSTLGPSPQIVVYDLLTVCWLVRADGCVIHGRSTPLYSAADWLKGSAAGLGPGSLSVTLSGRLSMLFSLLGWGTGELEASQC